MASIHRQYHGLSLHTTIRDIIIAQREWTIPRPTKPSPPELSIRSRASHPAATLRTALPPPASPLFQGGVATAQCHALALPVSTGRSDEPSAGRDLPHHPVGPLTDFFHTLGLFSGAYGPQKRPPQRKSAPACSRSETASTSSRPTSQASSQLSYQRARRHPSTLPSLHLLIAR
jgi:hypothetical protein